MLLFWLWLSLMPKMTDRDKLYMLQLAGSPENLYHADRKALLFLSPAEKRWAPLLDKSLDSAQTVLWKCQQLGIWLLPLDHPAYPGNLKTIPDPPLVLYGKGILPDTSRTALVGVVGTRNCSDYGLTVSRNLGYQLTLHGACTVSGMAAGIDAAVTTGALQAGGPAVGVLGCGVDIIYPKSSGELYGAMEAQGCLISEYPPGTPPMKHQFPLRNRIISGLSLALVVVEAPEKSGALITARQAAEQGRDLFVVPGNIGSDSCAGSNRLLKEGAGVVTCAWDVLECFADRYPDLRKDPTSTKPKKSAPKEETTDKAPTAGPMPTDLSPEEQKVLSALGPELRHLDALAEETGLPSDTILSALTTLEILGYAQTQPGNRAKLQ